MYGQVSGAAAGAGVPAALAFTGVTTAGLAIAVGAALLLIFAGVGILRHTYRHS